ncbi:magnesium-translocating P-type ATPase [Aquabacterium sp.]|uniref:magnesium-translocating P-type ATPase n=1 Tax=Aquabacterium sp. TaxID=1872578 RepID=UPI003784D978
MNPPPRWREQPLPALLAALHAAPEGLAQRVATQRLRRVGLNRIAPPHVPPFWRRLLARLIDPLVLVLLAASLVSALTGDVISFGVVALVVAMSVTLDLVQEGHAGRAVQALQGRVDLRVEVWRDGRAQRLSAQRLVPGDVVDLSAGKLVPADGRLLQAHDFFVNESALTGEAYPVEKHAAASGDEACLRQGSSVVSGSARLLVCATGVRTEFGQLAARLAETPPPTAFERGTRRFGLMLTRATLALVLVVLLVNLAAHRPLQESLLFALALAVGLTPELLPMILSVTLARGAVRLAREQVIAKRPSALLDLAAMDILCTDKTGTLTEARMQVDGVFDPQGAPSDRVFRLAWLNSHFETGLKSPLDDAILAHGQPAPDGWQKIDEVPFDFERRCVSVLLQGPDGARLLVAKGAPEDVLRRCQAHDTPAGPQPLDEPARAAILQRFEACGAHGLRLIAVASRQVEPTVQHVSPADERDLVFAGFVAFTDPPKPGAAEALRRLIALGITPKVITGDNEQVTRHLCAQLKLPVQGVLNGPEIAAMDDRALRAAAAQTTLFCRVTPEQKNRVVRALRADGHVVGYLGDGINDAPPLHSADVGLSVDSAVDVAREAAHLVLMRHELGVLADGVVEGRRTAANVDKYLKMATSSNFGNMASMAAAALFLPFLPMRPLQILLNNFLYDLSELAIPTDRVAEAELQQPRRWDVAAITRFMLCFGPLSSLFDLLAFGWLYAVLHVSAAEFQTAWFVQSLATQVLVIFVIRTAQPAWRDHPSPALALGSLAVVALACALPWLPALGLLGFVPLSGAVAGGALVLTLGYLLSAELAKHALRRFVAGR